MAGGCRRAGPKAFPAPVRTPDGVAHRGDLLFRVGAGIAVQGLRQSVGAEKKPITVIHTVTNSMAVFFPEAVR